MMRKKRQLLLLIVLLLLLTGCWNRRELNDLGIAVGLGLDKVGKQYQVSAQVVDPAEVAAKKGASARTPVILFRASGNTIAEALRKLTTESPRRIYVAHLRMLVIGESLAREGMGKALDFLSRDQELRTDFFIVVAKGTRAENTLKILTSLEDIPAVKLFSSLQTSEENWAPTLAVTLDELITDLVSEGKHPVLTSLELKGNKEAGQTRKNVEVLKPLVRLEYTGLAVFKKDKLIGWLSPEESKGYNFLVDNVNTTIGHLTCPDGGKLGVEVIRAKTIRKGQVKNGKPQINVEVRIEQNVGEVACKIDLTKPKTIYELEKKSEQRVTGIIENAIKKVQKTYKVDIFGFGKAIYRADPAAWQKLKKNWDKTFVNLPVNVKVDVKIRRLGTVSNSFLNEMKK